MVIFGIDPGTARMGYGAIKVSPGIPPVLRSFGCIVTKPEMTMPKRLKVLYTNLYETMKEFSPDLVVVEKLFFNTNVKTAMTVGQARGISLLVAADQDIEVVEYTALQAKKQVAGYGRAGKKEMQESVRKVLGLSQVIKSDDANDGVAMALCYYFINLKSKSKNK